MIGASGVCRVEHSLDVRHGWRSRLVPIRRVQSRFGGLASGVLQKNTCVSISEPRSALPPPRHSPKDPENPRCSHHNRSHFLHLLHLCSSHRITLISSCILERGH